MVVCHFFGVRSLQRHPMTAMVSLITHWSTVCLSACPILTTIKIAPFHGQLVCDLINIVCDIKPILDKTESSLDMATVCLLFLDNAYDNDSNALWGTSVMNLFDFTVQATWKFDLEIVNQHHYSDVTMGVMASQITSLTIVYSTVYSGADLRNIKAPRHWPLWGEFTAQMASNAEKACIWWRHYVLWPSDAIWRYRSRSTLTKVMARYLMKRSHHLNQRWLIICKAQWHSSEGIS